MSVKDNLHKIKSSIPSSVTLIAVTKTHPISKIMEAYNSDHKIFGENKVQDLSEKYNALPKDIQWHMIGHLQTNKVKFIAPFIHLIHSIDSYKLLNEINKEAIKNNRIIDCLLQIHIAQENTKFGFSFQEAEELLSSDNFKNLKNVCIRGLMGMASNTSDKHQIAAEFKVLNEFYYKLKEPHKLDILSMGMSSDFEIAIENGSTMIRVGSSIFGSR